MRHLIPETFRKHWTPDFGPVCEADLVTTGSQFLAPFLIREWISAGLSPSEALEMLLLADLEPAALEALLAYPVTH